VRKEKKGEEMEIVKEKILLLRSIIVVVLPLFITQYKHRKEKE
jgi:hypothetical protein